MLVAQETHRGLGSAKAEQARGESLGDEGRAEAASPRQVRGPHDVQRCKGFGVMKLFKASRTTKGE
eukprot:3206004-Pleurochrysis_carterae.AAC.1